LYEKQKLHIAQAASDLAGIGITKKHQSVFIQTSNIVSLKIEYVDGESTLRQWSNNS